MNRNSIIGFILIAGIMIFYTVYMTPSQEELAEQQKQDSIAAVTQYRVDSIRTAAIAETQRQQELEQAQIQPTTGDVLAGVIAAMVAQGLSLWDAATTGVVVHAHAGDLAASSIGQRGLIASDIIDHLPAVLNPE